MSYLILILVSSVVVVITYTAKLYASNGGDIDPAEIANLVEGNQMLNTGLAVLQTLIMIFVVILFWKIFDKGSIKDLGLTNPLKSSKKLIFGLLFGFVSISFVFIVLLLFGQIEMVGKFSQPNISKWIIIDLFLFILVGINEEFFARGYCMTVLKQTNNKWVMVIISSAIFSGMHLLNPNTSFLGLLNIFLVGILFAIMFIKSGDLWMPIGYHITWNYFQGTIFGMNVSGQDLHGMYSIKLTTENIINGGAFGPEGGLITTLVILVGTIYIWKFTYNESVMELK